MKIVTGTTELFALVKEAEVMVTPNSRIARFIQADLITSGCHSASEAAKVKSYSNWLIDTYKKARDCGAVDPDLRIIDDSEAKWVWRKIIERSDSGIANSKSAAKLAYSAYNICNAYNISIEDPGFALSEDSVVFAKWYEEFSAFLKNRHCITYTQLEMGLLQSGYGGVSGKSGILLYLPYELTGNQSRLISQVARDNLTYYSYPSVKTTPVSLSYNSAEDELIAAADWVVSTSENNPGESIALVVSDLTKSKYDVVRALKDTYNNSHIRPTNGYKADFFNLSMGTAYSKTPLIRHSSLMLGLFCSGISKYEFDELVKSPYFPKIHGLVAVDSTACKQLISVNTSRFEGMEASIDALKKLKGLLACAENAVPSCWVKKFTHALQSAMGWPGKRGLTTLEYQIVNNWKALSESLIRYDALVGDIGIRDYQSLFEHISAEIVFHEESVISDIHILGAIEAEGIPFDHMRVLGVDDSRWPARVDRNPFIPPALQVTNNVPHCSAERELEYSMKLIESYRRLSEKLVFSYANIDSDGRARNRTPLLKLDDDVGASPINEVYHSDDVELQDFGYEKAPYTDELGVVGGSYYFKDYMKCQFLGFSKHRLGLKAEDDLDYGLGKNHQGTIFHNMMKGFWDEIKTQSNLLTLRGDYILGLLRECVEKATKEVIAKYQIECDKTFVDLENSRQVKHALRWIDIEKERPPFEVLATEKPITKTIGSITIDLVLDRIDLDLTTGSLLFWDYKTGRASIADMSVIDLIDPQLPLYAIDESNVGGVGYLKVSNKAIEGVGVVSEGATFSKVTSVAKSNRYGFGNDWGKNISAWKDRLIEESRRIQVGEIATNPVNGSQSCRSCDKQWLCRIEEQNANHSVGLQISENC